MKAKLQQIYGMHLESVALTIFLFTAIVSAFKNNFKQDSAHD